MAGGSRAVRWWWSCPWPPWPSPGGRGGIGVLAFGWLVAEGAAGRVTWAVDFAATTNPLYRAWRLALPDYLAMSWRTWALHAAWLVALMAWAARAWATAPRPPGGGRGGPATPGWPGRPARPAARSAPGR